MGIAYEVHGSGEPVLLVAGLGQSGIRRWHRVVALLAESHEVVTVDNRGIGRSGVCDEPFLLEDLARDALAVMTELGHETFFLAGHSMGGMIAQEIVRLAPERVRAAVLFSTTPGGPLSVAPEGGLDALRPEPGRPTWAKLTGPGFAEAHPGIIDEETQISLEVATPPQMYLMQLQAISQWPGADLEPTGVPLLVVHGDHDPLVPYENGVRLAAKHGVELVTYEGAGHMIDCERPAEMVADMRRLFSSVLAAADR